MTDVIGPQRVNDRRGWLIFDHLPDDIRRHEDATLHNDSERTGDDWYGPVTFNRPATPTERELLAHLGYELPDALTTRVLFITRGIRNRRWPQLEQGS